MKVILREKVEKLGKKGDIKEVAEGFARNFLFPKHLAAPATPETLKMMQDAITQAEARHAKKTEDARALAERLKGHEVTIRLKLGEEGQAFGSVSAHDIVEALKKEKIHIEKEWVELDEPIKKTGGWNVPLKLPFGIEAEIKVILEKEGVKKEKKAK
ncbi:MAG: 50S ribosomal protein L9 [Candidatus Sungbacteria bacterium]|nr:50S ribosomal protein L9 [Candidatus Sungbacteria bacterium]